MTFDCKGGLIQNYAFDFCLIITGFSLNFWWLYHKNSHFNSKGLDGNIFLKFRVVTSFQVLKIHTKKFSNITKIVLLWYHVFDTYKTHRKIS